MREAVSNLSAGLLVWSGVLAAVVSSTMLSLFRALALTTWLPRLYWACTLFGSLRATAQFVAAWLRLVVLAVLMPLPYVLLFELLQKAELIPGAVLGTLHGLVTGALLPVLAGRQRCRGAVAPGFFGWQYGRATPVVLLIVHVFYGATLGYVYAVASP